MWYSILSFTLWAIRKNRNSKSFNNKKDKSNFHDIHAEAVEFYHVDSNKVLHARKLTIINVKWHPPIPHYYKLNIDGACLNNPGKKGSGELLETAGVARKLDLSNTSLISPIIKQN